MSRKLDACTADWGSHELMQTRRQALASEKIEADSKREIERIAQELRDFKQKMSQCCDELMQVRKQALDSEKLGAHCKREMEQMAEELRECKQQLSRCRDELMQYQNIGADDKRAMEQIARELSECKADLLKCSSSTRWPARSAEPNEDVGNIIEDMIEVVKRSKQRTALPAVRQAPPKAETTSPSWEEAVRFILKTDFDSIGDHEDFKHGVLADIAATASVDVKYFKIQGLRAGVIVDLLIAPEVGEPYKVAQELQEQVNSPGSRLILGKLTSKTKNLVTSPRRTGPDVDVEGHGNIINVVKCFKSSMVVLEKTLNVISDRCKVHQKKPAFLPERMTRLLQVTRDKMLDLESQLAELTRYNNLQQLQQQLMDELDILTKTRTNNRSGSENSQNRRFVLLMEQQVQQVKLLDIAHSVVETLLRAARDVLAGGDPQGADLLRQYSAQVSKLAEELEDDDSIFSSFSSAYDIQDGRIVQSSQVSCAEDHAESHAWVSKLLDIMHTAMEMQLHAAQAKLVSGGAGASGLPIAAPLIMRAEQDLREARSKVQLCTAIFIAKAEAKVLATKNTSLESPSELPLSARMLPPSQAPKVLAVSPRSPPPATQKKETPSHTSQMPKVLSTVLLSSQPSREVCPTVAYLCIRHFVHL
jgi:hypothetical protein